MVGQDRLRCVAFHILPSQLFFKKGLCKTSLNTSVCAIPISPEQLKSIVTYLSSLGPEALVYVEALLISYFTLARSRKLSHQILVYHFKSRHILWVRKVR